MAFDKRAYNVAYNARRQAEKKAKAALMLAKRQANAAKARAAKAAKNGNGKYPAPVMSDPTVAYTYQEPPRWSMTDGKNIIDLGTAREGIVVAIDGRTVVNLITNP